MPPALAFENVAKSFTMHLRGGAVIPVVAGVSFAVAPGECVVLGGRSGIGKSSLLKMAYGSYACDRGRILVAAGGETVDVAAAPPRLVLRLRRDVLGYVSQFLRVVPRVSALDVVAEPLSRAGVPRDEARERAAHLLSRLNLPRRLFDLPPATFSGGEQQRVNIARGFITPHTILLLDEPTASLDAENRDVVAAMVAEKKGEGVAVLGIFHDAAMREAVADRVVDVARFAARFGQAA